MFCIFTETHSVYESFLVLETKLAIAELGYAVAKSDLPVSVSNCKQNDDLTRSIPQDHEFGWLFTQGCVRGSPLNKSLPNPKEVSYTRLPRL